MPKIGPFFYVGKELIFHAVDLSEGRKQSDKLDNSYSHETLWDSRFRGGEYIDYPRGRVVWDCGNDRAVVYIDRCVNRPDVLQKICEAFELTDYVAERDDHYRCRRCVGNLFGR